jgi:broad specificity phosphatase PhoE
MEIYLVRHGETGGNVAKRHQSEATNLTPKGREQIKQTATLLKELQPTHLISSSVLRAVESSRYIGEVLDMIPETNPLFAELLRPTFLQGHFHKSIRSFLFYIRWYYGFTNRQKDGGETYADLRTRIKAAQAVLAQYPADARVVVVSHSVFINFFIAHMCQEKKMSHWQAFVRFSKVLSIKNGSITKVVHNPQACKNTCAWSEG